MGELKNRKRVSISIDHKTIERLNELSDKSGVSKSKLVDWAIFNLQEVYKKGDQLKPMDYFDSTEG